MALLSQWEGRARGVWGGRGRCCGRAAGGRGPGGGGRSPRGARRVNPSAAGPSRRRSRSRGRRSGCRRGGREPGAPRSGGRSAARGRGGAGPVARRGPADRCAGGRAARAQAAPGPARGQEPGAERGPRARNPVPAPPVLCLAAGCGDHGRVGPPEACVGPGRAGVGGGPPGPPMGSGCRCGGAMSRRRTPSWTPSSASLRARVSGGGGRRGGGAGGGPSSPKCEWRGVPGAVCIGLVQVSGGCWPQAAGQGS